MIRLSDVWFRYDRRGPSRVEPDHSTGTDGSDGNDPANADGVAALRGVSLTVEPGEFVVLTGPNGAGKSTLLRHCNGLAEPDAGRVRVDGHDPSREPIAVRATVGTVFQRPRDQLVAARVGDDVAFGPENLGLDRAAIDRRVRASLATVGMTDRREERVTELSGGERARVALAGALAMDPSYLVLDEPFAGLDDPTRRGVLRDVRAMVADGVGVLLATHDLRDLLDPADRVVVLDDGRVVADDAPSAVRDRLAGFGVRAPGENPAGTGHASDEDDSHRGREPHSERDPHHQHDPRREEGREGDG